MRLVLPLMLLAIGASAVAQPAPAPLFTVEPIAGLCGAADDHRRILDANGFDPLWLGENSDGGGLMMVMNREGYWIALAWSPGAPGRACVIAGGERFQYAPATDALP